jgi:CheY-like chemotaxis protein
MPPRILIAEDDDLQGALLRRALEARGYEAEIVTDGLQAVRRLRTGAYDLALLDYHLPEVDGLAAARLLHDHFTEADRPGLIAVTATAEGLSAKEGQTGTSFDAVVSKRLGLAALLSVVESNLTTAAERHAGAVIARGRAAVQEAAAKRRRRILAPLAAIPALTMVTAFAAAFGWGMASLSHVDAALDDAARTTTLSVNATALVGAVQDTETSQRSYLATGAQADLALFEADAQRVDQLLVAGATMAADGTPGLGTAGPQDLISARLRILADEAQARHPTPIEGAPPLSPGKGPAAQLRDWASSLVTGSQEAVLTGLDAVRHNLRPVLAILGFGILYGLGSAARAVQRRWRGPILAQPTTVEMWPRQAAPPSTAWAAMPLLDSHGD